MKELMIPERIREKFLQEILDMYAEGELSASRASHMLGIPRAAFYHLLAEINTPLPKKLILLAVPLVFKCYCLQIQLEIL